MMQLVAQERRRNGDYPHLTKYVVSIMARIANLMHLHGEQPTEANLWDYDEALAFRNRMSWNRLVAYMLTHNQKDYLLQAGLTHEELQPFSDEERKSIFGDGVSHEFLIEHCPYLIADGSYFFQSRFNRTIVFDKYIFPADVTFLRCDFIAKASFVGAIFLQKLNISQSLFHSGVDFSNAIFLGNIIASYARFITTAKFNSALFESEVKFDRSKFPSAAFCSTRFMSEASFMDTEFCKDANFRQATFHKFVDFRNTKFYSDARFDATAFRDQVYYNSASFAESCIFLNATFNSRTTFSNVIFSKFVPDFRGASLHEATEWDEVRWPSVTQQSKSKSRSTPRVNKNLARSHVRAYARLKQEMERLKLHDDELYFFRKELRTRRELDARLTIQYELSVMYEIFSDYGYSIKRPLLLLILTLCGGALLYSILPILNNRPLPIGFALGLSFANIFSFLPTKRDVLSASDVSNLTSTAHILTAVQSFVGIVFIFLLVLAIRNRFRMK